MQDKTKIISLENLSQIIKEDFKDDLKAGKRGIAFYLVAVFHYCLKNFDFCEKLVMVIGSERHKSTRDVLVHVFEINCIYKRTMETLETCLKSVQLVDNEYFINEEKIPKNCDKLEILQKLPFTHAAIMIKFLLELPTVGFRASNDFFVFNEFDEDLLKYLKDILRNLSLM